MNRSTLLKAAAALPLLGPLMMRATPVLESASEEPEVLSTRFAMMTRGGQYLDARGPTGWPTLQQVEDAAVHGFDRFEIWSNIRGVVYAAPTRLGVRPVGWWSASQEQLGGYMTEAGKRIALDIPAWLR